MLRTTYFSFFFCLIFAAAIQSSSSNSRDKDRPEAIHFLKDADNEGFISEAVGHFCKKTIDGQISDDGVNTTSADSMYNYGLCLKFNGQVEKATEIFIESAVLSSQKIDIHCNFDEKTGFCKSRAEYNYFFNELQEYVNGQRLLFLFESKNLKNLEKLLKKSDSGYTFLKTVPYNRESLKSVLAILSLPIELPAYTFICRGNSISLTLNPEPTYKKRLIFKWSVLGDDLQLPPNTHEVTVEMVNTPNEKRKFDVLSWLQFNQVKNIALECDEDGVIQWDQLIFFDKITIEDCKIVSNGTKIFPKRIYVNGGSIEPFGNSTTFILNDFLDFDRAANMFFDFKINKNAFIDMSKRITFDRLSFKKSSQIKVLDWKSADWNISHLTLDGVDYLNKSKMSVKHITTEWSQVDISVLPESLKNLDIENSRDTAIRCQNTFLPNLKFLRLTDSSLNSCFSNSSSFPQLLRMTVIRKYPPVFGVNLENIPKSVRYLTLYQGCFGPWTSPEHTIDIVGNHETGLDKLVLMNYNYDEAKDAMNKFKTKTAVIVMRRKVNGTLAELVNPTVNTIFLSDGQGDGYKYENQTWIAFKKLELDEDGPSSSSSCGLP